MDVPSKSQIKKAGSTIRKALRGEDIPSDAVLAAADILDVWRRAHYRPLVSANNGLRSMAKTCRVEAEITQRLKRRQTILDKLRREPTLDMSRMQDIGGCRAVVATIADLRRLENHLKRAHPPVGYADYIANPRSSGYRGVHVIVEYQGRQIEIQLRTETMHRWALSAEEYSGLLGENLKRDGSHPIQLFLASASEIMALQEVGDLIPSELEILHQERRIEAAKTLPR